MRELAGVIVTSTIDSRLNFEVTATFPSGDVAGRAKSEFETLKEKKRQQIGNRGGAETEMMDSLTVEVRGAEVVLRGKTEAPISSLVFMVRNVGRDQDADIDVEPERPENPDDPPWPGKEKEKKKKK